MRWPVHASIQRASRLWTTLRGDERAPRLSSLKVQVLVVTNPASRRGTQALDTSLCIADAIAALLQMPSTALFSAGLMSSCAQAHALRPSGTTDLTLTQGCQTASSWAWGTSSSTPSSWGERECMTCSQLQPPT